MCLFTLYINIRLQGLIFCFYLHLIGLFPLFFACQNRIQINVSYAGFNKLTYVAA